MINVTEPLRGSVNFIVTPPKSSPFPPLPSPPPAINADRSGPELIDDHLQLTNTVISSWFGFERYGNFFLKSSVLLTVVVLKGKPLAVHRDYWSLALVVVRRQRPVKWKQDSTMQCQCQCHRTVRLRAINDVIYSNYVTLSSGTP